MHEASQHKANCFLTLTFNDEHLPLTNSVDKRDLQLFMKRLRKRLRVPVRFFACGEYGTKNYRPHYHMILFGYDFPDKKPWRRTQRGHIVHRSAELEMVWRFGHCEIGECTHQSAGYVARYVTDKMHGDDEEAQKHYLRGLAVSDDGDVVGPFRRPEWSPFHEWYVRPEFLLMSTDPGIGSTWFDKYAGDCFPSDFLIVDGKRTAVPRYYAKRWAERWAPENYGEVEKLATPSLKLKARRKVNAARHAADQVDARLITKHESQGLRAARLKREGIEP